MSNKPVRYPPSQWPHEMRSDMAAAFVDEPSVEAFLAKVRAGKYPRPLKEPQCQHKWSRMALKEAVAQRHGQKQDDAVEDVIGLI